jgi:transposase InsO family protein
VYDVRLADVVFVADTAQLPAVFDALARQNFMTVTNVRLSSADAFAAARDGYLYGPAPVSQVTATVETIWLRDWTSLAELQRELDAWRAMYNEQRPHQSLTWSTPSEVRASHRDRKLAA